MAGAARVGDTVAGSWNTGLVDHNGHYDPFGMPIHPVGTINGTISGNGSPNVFINGMPAALDGSTTTDEPDVCCQASGLLKHGVVIGSSSVIINGRRAAINGDRVNPHVGEVNITSGSGNVIFG